MNLTLINCNEIIEISDDDEKETFIDINFTSSPLPINLLDSSTEFIDINTIQSEDGDLQYSQYSQYSNSVHSCKHSTHQQIQQSESSSHSEDSIMYDKLTKSLNKPIDKSNKGYKLIQKMGYKPGDKIGKNNNGLDEPINVIPFIKKVNKFKKNKINRNNFDEENQQEESFLENVKFKIKRNSDLTKKLVNYLEELINKLNCKIVKLNFSKEKMNFNNQTRKLISIQDYIIEIKTLIHKLLDTIDKKICKYDLDIIIFTEILNFLKYNKIDEQKILNSTESFNKVMNSIDYLECNYQMINILYRNSKFYETKILD